MSEKKEWGLVQIRVLTDDCSGIRTVEYWKCPNCGTHDTNDLDPDGDSCKICQWRPTARLTELGDRLDEHMKTHQRQIATIGVRHDTWGDTINAVLLLIKAEKERGK